MMKDSSQDKVVRVIIVGGRPFPNYQAFLSQENKIYKIVILHTPEGIDNYKNLKQVLTNLAEKRVWEKDFEINAYSISETLDKLTKIKEHFPKFKMSIDVTSAPKISSFAAMEFVMNNANSELIYNNTKNGQLEIFRKDLEKDALHLKQENEFLKPPTVEEYLKIYGRQGKDNFKVSELTLSKKEALDLVNYVLVLKEEGVKFFDYLRKTLQVKVTNNKRKKTLNISNVKFLNELEEVAKKGFLRIIKKSNTTISIEIDESNFKFLDGKWLDFYTSKIAEKTGLFHDVKHSLEIPLRTGATNELDFIGILKERLPGVAVIGECKTGVNPLDTKELDKLNSLAEMIGGDYVLKLFITNRFSSEYDDDKNKKKSLENFKKQAEARKIKLIMGEDLIKLDEKIKEYVEKFSPL